MLRPWGMTDGNGRAVDVRTTRALKKCFFLQKLAIDKDTFTACLVAKQLPISRATFEEEWGGLVVQENSVPGQPSLLLLLGEFRQGQPGRHGGRRERAMLG